MKFSTEKKKICKATASKFQMNGQNQLFLQLEVKVLTPQKKIRDSIRNSPSILSILTICTQNNSNFTVIGHLNRNS